MPRPSACGPATAGVGVALGPVIGGFLLAHFWWGSIFLVNVPIVIFALIVGRLIVPNSKDRDAPALDPVGAGLSIIGLVTLVYGIIEAPSKGWGSSTIIGSLAVSAVVLTSFVLWELRSDHPMLNVEFFENPRFTAANISIVLVFFALFGSLFFLTQYLQFVLGYTALQAGLRLAPMALVLMVVAPVAGQLVAKVGTKAPGSPGHGGRRHRPVATSAQTTPTSGYWHVLAWRMAIMRGRSLACRWSRPRSRSWDRFLPLNKAGVGSAMNDTTREVGGAVRRGYPRQRLWRRTTRRPSAGPALGAAPALAAAKSSLGGPSPSVRPSAARRVRPSRHRPRRRSSPRWAPA